MGTGSVVNLQETGVVCLDTNVVIYTVEKHHDFLPLLTPLWKAVDAGKLHVVVSELVLMESLILPYREGNSLLISHYEAFFKLQRIQLIPVSASILRSAAKLRASYVTLRSPDAIHAATTIESRADCLLTNDLKFRNLTQLNTVHLSDLPRDGHP